MPPKGLNPMHLRTASVAAAFVTAISPTVYAAVSPPPGGCTSAESRQFDFWVGRWDVFKVNDRAKPIAHSLIERLYAGCGIRENWMPFSGHNGGSLNAYDATTKKWRQFWTDSDGSSALFIGKWTGSAMVIQGVWPQPRQTGADHADHVHAAARWRRGAERPHVRRSRQNLAAGLRSDLP